MSEVTEMINSVTNGVRKTIRNFLIFAALLLLAFNSGWLKIVCDTQEMKKDTASTIEKVVGSNSLTREEQKYENIEKQLRRGKYRLVEHILGEYETIYDLQQIYGTDMLLIQRFNNLRYAHYVKPGQIILVPVKVERSLSQKIS